MLKQNVNEMPCHISVGFSPISFDFLLRLLERRLYNILIVFFLLFIILLSSSKLSDTEDVLIFFNFAWKSENYIVFIYSFVSLLSKYFEVLPDTGKIFYSIVFVGKGVANAVYAQ